jgi:hypothetical protein
MKPLLRRQKQANKPLNNINSKGYPQLSPSLNSAKGYRRQKTVSIPQSNPANEVFPSLMLELEVTNIVKKDSLNTMKDKQIHVKQLLDKNFYHDAFDCFREVIFSFMEV